MTNYSIDQKLLEQFVKNALEEDVKNGDHSTLSCIDPNANGSAELIFKSNGIAAGIEIARFILTHLDPNLTIISNIKDGDSFEFGEIGFNARGNIHALLKGERLLLNCMQRLSAIATETKKYVDAIQHTKASILDTRKTTPNLRFLEKWAVTVGGGLNHRHGLYDMIMLKDNHIDFCGGIEKALHKAHQYRIANNLDIKIEVETRNIEEVNQALKTGIADRIMLDNFELTELKKAVALIGNNCQTEASGGINLNTVRSVAETGVQFISVGALTHGVKSLDISFKTRL